MKSDRPAHAILIARTWTGPVDTFTHTPNIGIRVKHRAIEKEQRQLPGMTDEEYIEPESQKLEERELDDWMRVNVGDAGVLK